jgi:hypothetical protein
VDAAAGRHETGNSLRWNALGPGFPDVPMGLEYSDHDADGAGVI